jgi:hypothetical protein
MLRKPGSNLSSESLKRIKRRAHPVALFILCLIEANITDQRSV